MMTRYVRSKLALIASAMTIATPAFAADGVEEVVVTAQKRTESLQDVSVSVAVTTAEDLLDSGIKDAEILSQQLPAINISKGGASDQMYIRGIGSGFNGGFEQAVGTYIDGLYIGRSRGTRASFVDLERIEVLKGPQSLYFGNSSIAGALSLTSQSPTPEFGGHFIALYEPDHEESNFEGAINVPMGEQFALRVAARKYDIDGYVDNTWTGDAAGGADDIFVRVSALWKPTERFDALLKYATGDSDRTSPFMKEVINCPSSYGSTNPLVSCNAQGHLLDNELDYRLQGGGDDFSQGEFTHASLTMDYEFDALIVSSTTGLVDNQQRELQDLDSGPMFIFNSNQYDDLEQFSQELRFSSNTDGTLEWMAGVYYQDGDVTYINVQAPNFLPTPAFQAAVASARASGRELGARQDYVQAETTTSAFSSVTWNINETNRLVTGVRWIEVEKDVDKTVVWGLFSDRTLDTATFQPVAPPFGGYQSVGVNTASEKWDDVLPTMIVEHDLSADAMVYASFSQGFKAGGYDFQNRDARIVPGFKEERVDAYELGYKGLLLDGSLRANVAMFYSDYSDVQESVLDPATFTFSVANAASSHTAGLDVELQYAATDRLELGANVVVMEAEYDEFLGQCSVYQTANSLCPDRFQDLGGHETTFAPRYSGNLKATYIQPIGEDWQVTIQPDVYFTDSYFIQSDFDPFTEQDAFWMLNLRLAVAPVSGDWEVALIGKNLNDEKTIFFANDLAGSDGSYVRSLNRPRTLAIQARWNF